MVGRIEKKSTSGVVVLSIRQENGRYTPELSGVNGSEQPIYSAHGRFCIDMDCGVHLARERYPAREYPSNTVEICNRIRYGEIDIVASGVTQAIVPFPHRQGHPFEESEIKVGQNIVVNNENGQLTVSFNHINSRCDLRIFDSSGSHQRNNPTIEARLSYVPQALADKMIKSEATYQNKMKKFFRKKGWDRLME